ncbi:Uncharacterized protein M6B38_230105 [Iris pallida]|uniref:Protein EARLY HEADING DATE 2 n=1 Tax=Iris pallida TaxID=29817 RepID=A0AAX6DSA2_IRIPA|nr:Uncharacterized protein M6B38_230105 [Iris pallida]
MSNLASTASPAPAAAAKKKRNLPGNPDPEAEVVALSPRTLTATNRFVCEVCRKGFQREQNLQLHRRGHSLPWKLKQRTTTTTTTATERARKKVYVCPEASCVHHSPSRALGDLTGIKKHFSRKHGEKKHKCDKCSKKYAVRSDWKAHSKTCGTRDYTCPCPCGTIFSRRDSFITHTAFCDALAEENAESNNPYPPLQQQQQHFNNAWLQPTSLDHTAATASNMYSSLVLDTDTAAAAAHDESTTSPPLPLPLPHLASIYQASPHLSATALLQKAAQMGATMSRPGHNIAPHSTSSAAAGIGRRNDEGGGGGGGLTRDFLGLRAFSHKEILSMAAAGLPSSFQHCQDQHY